MATFSGNSQNLYVSAELTGAEFFEFSSIWRAFNIGSFTVHIDYNRGGALTYDINSYAFDTSNIKKVFTDFANNGTMGLTPELAIELNNAIDAIDIHTCNMPALVIPNLESSATSVNSWTNVQMSGFYTPSGALIGVPIDNDFNKVGAIVSSGYLNGEYQEWRQSGVPICIFNIIGKAIEDNLIEVSNDLLPIIEDNMEVMPSPFNCKWDYYFNFSTEFLGRNATNSVIVRWSSPIVNEGTEEYLKENPDYKYSCALTKVILEVSNTVNSEPSSWKTIYTGWYGTGEKELPFNMLQDNTAMTQIAINVGKILPFTDKGDVYLKAHLEFSDGQFSSDVIGQCPYTSSSTDESKLKVYLPMPRDGSTLTLHYGTPITGIDKEVASWNEDAKEPKIDDDFENNDSDVDFNMDVGTNSNIGLLTKTYAITENQLQQIGNKIWTGYFTELIDALNSSPIENIISVKAFPFEITGGTSKQIMLGNVEMGVNGNELPSNYSPIKVIKSDFEITPRFSGLLKWLNYSPFTNIQMFLPYVGIVNINPQLVMGKKCTLKYIYDVILGNCQACLYVKDVNNKSVEIGKWSGQLAIDIPITASNAVRMGVGHFTGTLDAISSFLHGDILGAIKDGIGVATQPFHSMTKGNPSSACDSFDMQNVYLIIDSPIYKYPAQFGHIYGFPCELYLHLNDLHGFVQCENVHIDGIPCMEEERVELLALLEEGVYL